MKVIIIKPSWYWLDAAMDVGDCNNPWVYLVAALPGIIMLGWSIWMLVRGHV
jgi:hypothetical protein